MLSSFLPWEDYVAELVEERNEMINYRAFVSRYTIEPEGSGWTARLLGALHAEICKSDLTDTLRFFDPNQDGVTTLEELEQVHRREGGGVL